MGGASCVVIIEGNGVQGQADQLKATAVASCQLVDYLSNDEDQPFNEADAQPIEDFHLKAEKTLKALTKELDGINRALAAEYNRE